MTGFEPQEPDILFTPHGSDPPPGGLADQRNVDSVLFDIKTVAETEHASDSSEAGAPTETDDKASSGLIDVKSIVSDKGEEPVAPIVPPRALVSESPPEVETPAEPQNDRTQRIMLIAGICVLLAAVALLGLKALA